MFIRFILIKEIKMKRFLINLNNVVLSNYDKVKSDEVVRFEREINGEKVVEDFYFDKINNKLKSFTFFCDQGALFPEKRQANLFCKMVAQGKNNVVEVEQFLSKDENRRIFVFNRNHEIFGVKDLAILMTKEESPKDFEKEMCIDVSGLDLFSEKFFISDESPEKLESDIENQIYELCYHLKYGMNKTGINGLLNVFKRVEEYNEKNSEKLNAENFKELISFDYAWISYDVFNMFNTWLMKKKDIKGLNRQDYINEKIRRLVLAKEFY